MAVSTYISTIRPHNFRFCAEQISLKKHNNRFFLLFAFANMANSEAFRRIIFSSIIPFILNSVIALMFLESYLEMFLIPKGYDSRPIQPIYRVLS